MIAIHFTCTACGKHLEVDEAGAGATVRCTDCDAPVQVPWRTACAVCPHCQTPVLAADNLWGQAIECSTCRGTFEVPDPATAAVGTYIHFKCPACGKHIEIPEAGAGAIVQCPDCAASVKVPGKTARFVCPHCRTAVRVTENLWGTTFACATCQQPMAIQNPEAPIQHACPFCYMVVMLDRSMRGKFVTCPACRQQFHMPNPDVDVEQEGPAAEFFF